ncbi:MAG: glycoside hydrolase family 25 protein [Lachnospiraceae bacterium]
MNQNTNERKQKRNSNKDALIIILLCVSIISVASATILGVLYIKSKMATLETALVEEENIEENTESEVQINDEKEISQDEDEKSKLLNDIRVMMQEGDTALSLLQYLFPDEIVVADGGKYHFFKVNKELKQNKYVEENFTLPIKNEETGKYEGDVLYHEDGVQIGKKGIDVSKFQGTIDWKKVKNDGIEYAIIRLGFRGYESGKIVLDETYLYNIKGSLEAGIDTGVYFFTEALTESEAIEEAEFVIENLNGYNIKMPVVIDVEESASLEKTRTKNLSKEQRTKNVIAFCEKIKEAGYEPMIYGNLKSFMIMLEFDQLESYEKWFAYYRYPLNFPYNIKMWQYTASGKVDGISENTDINIMFY